VGVYDLRDPTPHYGSVSMGSEDRTALSVAADRERARIFRNRWYETWVGKVSAVAGLLGAVAAVVTVLWHR
jgi:hypothetical protein